MEKKAVSILQKYTDQRFSFVDAASFALMKKMEIERVLTLSNHFSRMGFQIIPLYIIIKKHSLPESIVFSREIIYAHEISTSFGKEGYRKRR